MATAIAESTRPRRSSSLREKYPGDPSTHPLDTLKREEKSANRSAHLRKKHHHGSDSIDKLDDAALLGAYHHEGPYDAASLARNNSYTSAPVAALAQTNREALRATPRESVRDSLQRHRPLDNVAALAPGQTDAMGRTYHYKEGAEEDIMRDPHAPGGAYKRYDGVVSLPFTSYPSQSQSKSQSRHSRLPLLHPPPLPYPQLTTITQAHNLTNTQTYLPEDLKGKGEPSYSLEKQIKDHKQASQNGTNGHSVELADRSRRTSDDRRRNSRLSGSTRRSEDYGYASRDPFRDRAGAGDDVAAGANGDGDENGIAHLREHSPQERSPREVETMSRAGSASGSGQRYGDWERERGHRRDGSGSAGLEGLKRRIGSLRRKDK